MYNVQTEPGKQYRVSRKVNGRTQFEFFPNTEEGLAKALRSWGKSKSRGRGRRAGTVWGHIDLVHRADK